MSALRTMASTNAYSIQTFSIKDSLVFRKGIQLTMQFRNLQAKYTTISSKKNFTVGVFTYLSKAFDNVDHNILLKKIETNGIT